MSEEGSGTDDRRREERIEFHRDCTLEVLSPSWARVDKPLEGSTGNLTLHGVQVLFDEFSFIQYETWKKHVEVNDSFRVSLRVNLTGQRRYEGQVVWLDFEGGPGTRGVCSLGILLDVMEDDDRAALERALAESRSSG